MCDFDSLANTCEQHGVVSHDVATANGGEANGGWITLTRVAKAFVNGTIFEVAANRIGNDFAHFQSSA